MYTYQYAHVTFITSYVCPTEIIAFSDAAKRFEEIGAKVIGA